jgi:hypothetical protein
VVVVLDGGSECGGDSMFWIEEVVVKANDVAYDNDSGCDGDSGGGGDSILCANDYTFQMEEVDMGVDYAVTVDDDP